MIIHIQITLSVKYIRSKEKTSHNTMIPMRKTNSCTNINSSSSNWEDSGAISHSNNSNNNRWITLSNNNNRSHRYCLSVRRILQIGTTYSKVRRKYNLISTMIFYSPINKHRMISWSLKPHLLIINSVSKTLIAWLHPRCSSSNHHHSPMINR